MDNEDIPIKLKDGTEISGNHTLVIVGPNGSGKTTYGSDLASRNNVEWISATRNLAFEDTIPISTTTDSEKSVQSLSKQARTSKYMANELNHLLILMKAQALDNASKFTKNWRAGQTDAPETTNLEEVSRLWNQTFPNRKIDFSESHTPTMLASHRNNTKVPISQMSGGERVALYLLAKVVYAKPGIIVIDEPEIHLHSQLARKFWDSMEAYKTKCRFIYITHDLPFVFSRKKHQLMIVKSIEEQNLLEHGTSLPEELSDIIIGAATFSISAKRIVFCEGKRDLALYSAWFFSDDTEVVVAGDCKEVIKCVEIFNSRPIVNGIQAIPIA